jgi:hypothetical protein
MCAQRQWILGCATMTAMKRSTAIGRLRDVCEGLDRAKQWSGVSVTAGYLYGALLEGDDDLEFISIALVVDEPAESVPWMSRPAHLEAMAKLLRLDKLPIAWRWRPAEWPVWNHQISSAACFWNADGGLDQTLIDALNARDTDGLQFAYPVDADDLRRQIEIERVTARRHLADVTAMFGDREWRRDHRGDGWYPEDTLWAAAAGFIELDDWLNR